MKALKDPVSRRRAAASRWFVVLQEPDLPTRVLHAWKKWESVPENRQVFDEIERLWARTDDLARPHAPGARALSSDQYDGAQSIVVWRRMMRQPSQSWLRSSLQPLALAATLALLVTGVWAVMRNGELHGGDGRMAMFETAIAQNRDVVLDDGSKVRLGAKTAITAHVTPNLRTVVLDRGEALFEVVRDARRPFKVIAGSRTITAVGTAFNVRRRGEDQVVVTVTDGVVQIASNTAEPLSVQPSQVRRLERGQQIAYDKHGNFGELRPADEGSAVAWREGRLLYRSEPLRDVLPDIDRYSHRSIVLSDRAAGELLYSGTVFERDVDEWIANLEKVYPDLKVTLTDTDSVLIQMRKERPEL